jgi:hypothetical protein
MIPPDHTSFMRRFLSHFIYALFPFPLVSYRSVTDAEKDLAFLLC